MSNEVKVNIPEWLDEMGDPQFYHGAMKNGANKTRDFLATEYYPKKNSNEPNRLGGRRTNFWTDIGRSISRPITKGLSVLLRFKDPRFAQKLYGGLIRPKRVQWLTIPVSAEAHARSAEELQAELGRKLFVWTSSKKEKFLAESVDGRLRLHYVLKKSVEQRPTKGALPTEDEMLQAFAEGVDDYIDSQQRLR